MARPSGIGARILRKSFSGFVQGSAPDVERRREEGRKEGGRGGGRQGGRNQCGEKNKQLQRGCVSKTHKRHHNPKKVKNTYKPEGSNLCTY